MMRFIGLWIVMVFLMAGCDAQETTAAQIVTQGELSGTPAQICDQMTPARNPSTREFEAPEEILQEGVDYRAVFCTEVGPIYVDLFEEYTPVTVNSFMFLAQAGYYNNTTFHRVLADFMAQGGDPTGTGRGGPGYQFRDEFVGFLTFDVPGLLAMANAGPGTNGSQFFITTSTPTYLNYAHTIFGQVLEGQETVLNIRLRDPQSGNPPAGTLLETVVIIDNIDAVTSSFEPPSPATQEDIEALIAELPEVPGLTLIADEILSTDETVDTYSQDVQAQIDELLKAQGHAFTARIAHLNENCSDGQPYRRFGYTLHTFAGRNAAAAAREATAFTLLITDGLEDYDELESEALAYPIYVSETTACDAPAVIARTFWQRGRFIAVAEVVLSADSRADADLWLDQVVGRQIYENLLSSVLRPEIWNR